MIQNRSIKIIIVLLLNFSDQLVFDNYIKIPT